MIFGYFFFIIFLPTRIIVVKKKRKRDILFLGMPLSVKIIPAFLFNHHNQVFSLFPEIIFIIDFQGHITVFTGLQSIGISRMDRK